MDLILWTAVFCEWKLLAALGAASMNQCAPVMMSLNEIGFIIDERSAAGKDLTYFTENKKMTEDSNTSDISSDPYLLGV